MVVADPTDRLGGLRDWDPELAFWSPKMAISGLDWELAVRPDGCSSIPRTNLVRPSSFTTLTASRCPCPLQKCVLPPQVTDPAMAIDHLSGVDPAGAEKQHYADVVADYDSNFFYSGEYQAWQLDVVTGALQAAMPARSGLRVADVGGGTGKFTQKLREALRIEGEVECVDPSPSMLQVAEGLDGIRPVCADAGSYAAGQSDNSVDAVLMKEVIHHIPREGDGNLIDTLAQLRRVLRRADEENANPGVVLVVTRPNQPDYPLFAASRSVWAEAQVPAREYERAFQEAGFSRVESEVCALPLDMPLETWVEMVRQRIWSTFSREHFDDVQLEKGIDEIRQNFPTDTRGHIQFEERLIVVSAFK